MKGLIQASLSNPYAVIVMSLTMAILGSLALLNIPVDILPVFRTPAVQVLTFYGGMPAKDMEKVVTLRMEKWTGQANGMKRQESRSIFGTSIVRNIFQDGQDPSSALTQVNSLALATLPYLPKGTLPPVVLPFDPTATTPIALIAMNSDSLEEAELYDIGRLEVRNMAMQNPGTVAPVVIGGKLRAVMIYLRQREMQAHKLGPTDVMNVIEKSTIFVPSGSVKIGGQDIALSSNSMVEMVDQMKNIPIHLEEGKFGVLGAIADPEDASFIQTSLVLVNGRKQVYIPIYRQVGASTLDVVDTLKETLPDIKAKLSKSDVKLDLVMDQSVYVRASIDALRNEGLIGALLCSLVILVFLGQWRMTLIAILTLPLSVLMAIIGLYATGQTINVMTLAGLTLAIGPMIDSAIICLENTHRHLGMGATTHEAAFLGASEVAMPELVSTLCTFLVLSPLVLTPGLGQFLFKPMAMAVAYSMIAAYFLSRTLVPACSAYWLKPHGGAGHGNGPGHGAHVSKPEGPATFTINGIGNGNGTAARGGFFGPVRRAFARWERTIDRGIEAYVRGMS